MDVRSQKSDVGKQIVLYSENEPQKSLIHYRFEYSNFLNKPRTLKYKCGKGNVPVPHYHMNVANETSRCHIR
jgi:hypothetical protein